MATAKILISKVVVVNSVRQNSSGQYSSVLPIQVRKRRSSSQLSGYDGLNLEASHPRKLTGHAGLKRLPNLRHDNTESGVSRDSPQGFLLA